MDILNNLVEKASETGKKTMQKTKGISITSKLNLMISEEEKKIDNYYYQIGKVYASIHQEDYENDFSGLINAIKQSENKIEEYKRKIMDIKGIQCCEKCGGTIFKGAVFCSACGAPVPKMEFVNNEHEIKCPKCGTFMSDAMCFCTVCGTEMRKCAEQVLGVGVIVSEIHGKICHNCGTKLDEEAVFCSECGIRLGE